MSAPPREPSARALVDWWRHRPARAGDTRVLALDGRSGAGKTRLADHLAGQVAGAELAVVHLDDLYPGWDGLRAGITRVVEQVLVPLATGTPAGYRCWDWDAGTDGDWRPVPARGLLLLEGVGAGALACAPYLSGLVWLAAPEPLRRDRALARDGEAYTPHWRRWAAQEREYLRRDLPHRRADLILDVRRKPG